jgi:predicted GIY-YIG superfamily endonuclease
LCCRFRRQLTADDTDFLSKRPESNKNRDPVPDFKPIQAKFRLATKAACDYTKRPEVNHYVYVISCPLGLVKLGVATNPKQRVQNLQIGSPVPLELAWHYAMSDRATAEEVVAALQERFRDRRERGHWFRAARLRSGR